MTFFAMLATGYEVAYTNTKEESMTFGAKLKGIRARLGWSQEELANMLGVSRQSITKWEQNDGLPDTFNAKQMAGLFGVSIDYLLDNEREIPLLTVRVQIDPAVYVDTKGPKKMDSIIKHYFVGYQLYPLLRERKWSKAAAAFDFLIGPGTLDVGDSLANMSMYFLVERNNVQQLVNIKDGVMTIKELAVRYSGRRGEKHVIDGYRYTISGKAEQM